MEFSEFVYSVRKLCEFLRDRPDILDRDEELEELVQNIEEQLDEYVPHQVDEDDTYQEEENNSYQGEDDDS